MHKYFTERIKNSNTLSFARMLVWIIEIALDFEIFTMKSITFMLLWHDGKNLCHKAMAVRVWTSELNLGIVWLKSDLYLLIYWFIDLFIYNNYSSIAIFYFFLNCFQIAQFFLRGTHSYKKFVILIWQDFHLYIHEILIHNF